MNIEIRGEGLRFEKRIITEEDLEFVEKVLDLIRKKITAKKMCSECGKNEVDDLSDWCGECLNNK